LLSKGQTIKRADECRLVLCFPGTKVGIEYQCA